MTNDKSSFEEVVERVEEQLRSTWDDIPPETRRRLDSTLKILPGNLKNLKALIEQSIEHIRLVAGHKRVVVILGPANVGKSTLFNTLIREKGDRAKVSPIPGTTRRAQASDAGIFVIVDTPGADVVGEGGARDKEKALEAAKDANMMIILFDATQAIRASEKRLLVELLDLGIPAVVALNKMDLIKKEHKALVKNVAESLEIESDQITPISARTGKGVADLLRSIVKIEPEIVAALGAALPAYRMNLAHTVIIRFASTAGAIALTPLPFIDFIPLIGLQSTMVLSIARIYAHRITLARARELLVTFGIGILGRTLFYELSKLGGLPGWLISSAVAAGTTVALGYTSAVWFERGERLSREAIVRISRTVSETLMVRLKNIGRRRPKGAKLRERLRQTLDELPSQQIDINDQIS